MTDAALGPEPIASVLVPTHDHGPTLRPAIASALAQTVGELEVLLVGDGMPPAAAAVARELAAADPRVRLFEFEKGERYGEAHRHVVISGHARARFILYLADDDLWLPDHVETLIAALEDADFVASTALTVVPGALGFYPHDLARPESASLMMGDAPRYNRVGLSVSGHTRGAYEGRRRGWSPAPAGLWSDLHFWRGFVGDEGFRCRSLDRVTVVNFPSPARREMTPEARVAELEHWLERIASPGGPASIRADAAAACRAKAVGLDLDNTLVQEQLRDCRRWAEGLRDHADALERHVAALERLPELRWRRTRLGRWALGLRARLARRP